MTENTIRIRPIGDLLNEKFRVPRYQRGYRWDKQQITELLDDILEYHQNPVGKFYCLQPIVVKKATWNEKQEDGTEIEITGWDLIDGQQRLTTLFVILTYLEDVRQHHDNSKQKFSISFETRDNFLNNNKFVEKNEDSNIDFYHISKCYEYVKEWFKDKLPQRLYILKRILEEKDNVSVIWYQIEDTKDESETINIFKRLNIGKIPLTDAELIKALILQGDKYPKEERQYIEQRLFEIATEWDEMEATFKDEKFWFFITNDEKSNIGIEFIFKLLADEWHEELKEQYKIKRDSKHFAYLVFNKYIEYFRSKFSDKNPDKDKNVAHIEPINEIWEKIKDLFSVFTEWYSNPTLYHYIGYLITIDKANIKELIKLSRESNKSDFVENLRKKIGIAVNYKVKKKENTDEYKTLSDYTYGYDNAVIISILLLFNIETIVKTLKKENYRFPFHLYKKEKITSIEHIHPQHPEDFSDDEPRANEWLNTQKSALNKLPFKDEDRADKRNQFVKTIDELLIKYDKDTFSILLQDILNFYDEIAEIKEKENEKHTLYNLALVDKDTNSALNNSPFDAKREILKTNERGRYIPICTMRAFEKYYTEAPREMIFWSDPDRKAYFKAIETVINSFINQ